MSVALRGISSKFTLLYSPALQYTTKQSNCFSTLLGTTGEWLSFLSKNAVIEECGVIVTSEV